MRPFAVEGYWLGSSSLSGRIDAATLKSAIEIAWYLIPHAEAALGMMMAKEDSADADAQYLLRWIMQRKLEEFSVRDAHQHGRRRFRQVSNLDSPLAELTKRGYIRKLPNSPSKQGRPPSPRYEVNLKAIEIFDAEKRPQNPQYSGDKPLSNSNEDIEYASDESSSGSEANSNWEAAPQKDSEDVTSGSKSSTPGRKVRTI